MPRRYFDLETSLLNNGLASFNEPIRLAHAEKLEFEILLSVMYPTYVILDISSPEAHIESDWYLPL